MSVSVTFSGVTSEDLVNALLGFVNTIAGTGKVPTTSDKAPAASKKAKETSASVETTGAAPAEQKQAESTATSASTDEAPGKVTIEQLRVAVQTAAVEKNQRPKVIEVFAKFGVEKVTQLQPEHYAEALTLLNEIQ